jgi:glycosyltransferase involved in cell wall biosynthesis
MKIGMISLYLPSQDKCGAGYQAHYMGNAMVAAGHEVVMHSPAAKPIDAAYAHVRVDPGQSMRTFRFAWNLRKVDWSGFDVVHAHGDDYWLWRAGNAVHVRTMHGSCLAEALHVPRVKEKLRMAGLGLSEILATWVADRTVCVSENTRAYYPWVKDVIMNGVDTGAFHPGGEKEKVPTIVFVGTYQNRKRGKLLHEAFTQVIRPALPEAQLWMVCSDAPAAEGVRVCGSVDLATLADLYRRAWVFCLPSSYEGFGVPYIEAMASGTPVVATPNVGALEVLDHGKYGVIVEPEELGGTLLALLQNGSRREEMRTAGLERSRVFSWGTIVGQYERVYAELLSRKTTGKKAVSVP